MMLLTEAMYDAGLQDQIPVSIPNAFLYCLGKRAGIHEERQRRKENTSHE